MLDIISLTIFLNINKLFHFPFQNLIPTQHIKTSYFDFETNETLIFEPTKPSLNVTSINSNKTTSTNKETPTDEEKPLFQLLPQLILSLKE